MQVLSTNSCQNILFTPRLTMVYNSLGLGIPMGCTQSEDLPRCSDAKADDSSGGDSGQFAFKAIRSHSEMMWGIWGMAAIAWATAIRQVSVSNEGLVCWTTIENEVLRFRVKAYQFFKTENG